MKRISKFVADDGSEHDSESAARRRDSTIKKVDAVMSRLKPLPSDRNCDFANGRGHVKQSKRAVEAAISAIFDMCRKDLQGFKNWVEAVDKDGAFKYRNSLLHRLVSECIGGPVAAAFSRFGCIDDSYREWGQPYYALHPEAAEFQGEISK